MADAREIYRHRPTQQEIDEVLAQRLVSALGTLNEDGSVHLAYVIFLFANDHFYIETSSVTRKARNAAARERATLLLQGVGSEGRNLMVSAEGSARILRGDEAQETNRRVRAKYIRPEARDALEKAWGPIDDVSIEITPTRWRSWTGTLLHAAALEHLESDYQDAWLD
jgi:nitroimidazol reductase NimA-like FMN-containing flavoprotein (pyridoxamine 5'-phosphate oxidase superfamily)